MSRHSSHTHAAGALLVCAGLLMPAASAISAPSEPGDQLLVGFASDSPRTQRLVADRHETRVVERLPIDGAALVEVPADRTAAEFSAELARDPRVEWSEPNGAVRRLLIPNDPSFGAQWGLRNTGQLIGGVVGTLGADIGAAAAWDTTTGSSAVRVAVLDGGVDATVADLAPNVPAVTNASEAGDGRESNGLDDDGNGLVDDVHGWDWVDEDNDPRDEDSISHGTHVASVIAARGDDGSGLTGVSWQASILRLRVLDSRGSGTVADVASGLAHAGQQGARIVNVSLGGTVSGQTMQAAIDAYPNTLYVVAAGNSTSDNDSFLPSMPCAVPSANVICVAATDQDDGLASFSNVGATTVDLGAPGVNVLGARRGGGTQLLDGTSFSAPHVAGVAALVLAQSPNASTAQVRDALLAGVTPLPALAGQVATGGRVNAAGALANVSAPGTAPAIEAVGAEVTGGTSARLSGSIAPDGSPATYHFEWGTDTSYGSQTTVRSVGSPGQAADHVETISGLQPLTTYHVRLVATDIDGVAFGPDTTFTTGVAPPAPAPWTEQNPLPSATVPSTSPSDTAPASSPADSRPTTLPRPSDSTTTPRVRVVRGGGVWRARLKLSRPAVVSGRLQRRVLLPPNAGRSGRALLTSARGLRRRGYAAGPHQLVLGRLRPGTHRLILRVRSDGHERVFESTFHVSGPRPPRLAIARRAGTLVAQVRAFGSARFGGRVETFDGRRVATIRRRDVAAGRRVVVPLRGLPAGAHRVRIQVWEGHRRTRLVAVLPAQG